MAKYQPNKVAKSAEKKYPSTYGSHESMLSEVHSEFNESGDIVICEDALGYYVTSRKALDNGMCDGNRNKPIERREAGISLHVSKQQLS